MQDPHSCFETWQQAVVPSPKCSFHRTPHLIDNENEARMETTAG